MKIAIITDSTSDISQQEAEQHHITIIPAILVIEGKEYLDGKNISREEYYNRLPSLDPPPTTSAPSTGMFAEAYQALFDKGYDHIVSIHVASTLSGMFNAAKIAADSFGDRITVVDSGQLTLGLGFQVLAAAKAALEGKIESVMDAINRVKDNIQVIAMIDTLDQLKRSGRVSWLRSSLGSLLKIKLFLQVKDGNVLRLGEARTRAKAMRRLTEILESLGPLEELAIVHTNALSDATQMAQDFLNQVNNTPLIRNVTTVIGTHVGVNAVGFIAVRAE